jgi:hypothetical protein
MEPEHRDEDVEGVAEDEDRDAVSSGEEPLARVRYGLGKELRLYPDTFVIEHLEEHQELRLNLDNIKRMILAPGDPNPSKLLLMFDLDDGNTIIGAEGVSNVRDFRKLLAVLREIRPGIELDPPDMDAQLAQALDIRRRSLLGCYGIVIGICLLGWILFLVVAFIGTHAAH